MNITQMSETLLDHSCIQNLRNLLNESTIESFARDSKFIERSTSRLSGSMFLELNVCHFKEQETQSLNDLCDYLLEKHEVNMTKQSLDERFNTHSVKFMRGIYTRLLEGYLQGQEDFTELSSLCKYFTGIKLTDSTSFQLPSHLAHFYASNGGDTSGSSVKIHQCYDLLRGQITDLMIKDGKSNDASYWSEGHYSINAQELHITDLGYFKLSHLQAIIDAKAYFLTRYKVGTNLYHYNEKGNLVRFELADYLSKHPEINHTEISVLVGKKAPITMRLFVEKVPEEIHQQRLKKYKARHKKVSSNQPKYSMTQNSRILCGYNLFLSNAPALNIENVRAIYSLRWQIELLFKIWKSLFQIDKISKMSIFRFECYLYGRLIALLISDHLQSVLKHIFYQEIDLELSEWKTMKQLKKNA